MSSKNTLTAIERVEIALVRIPVDPPRGDAIQKFDALEIPFVTIYDGSGLQGTGFGYTIGTGGTTIRELLHHELQSQLIGEDSRHIAHIHHKLNASIHALTPGCITSTALAAIDVALWDLAGKRTKTPLYILLGGAKKKVPIYNTHVGWLNRPLDEMVALCKEAVERDGFKAVKLKVGKPDIDEDEERVAAVRKVIGRANKLMVDANQSWRLPEAMKRAKMLEKYDLVWLEEPVLATEIDAFVRLGQHTIVPRAGGESIYAIEDFFQYLRCGALDILQPDIARIGGITNALRVCAMAQAAGLPVAPHVSPELSVTVAAAVPNSIYVEFIPQMKPILTETVKIIDGFAIPSEDPGHGIKFDEDALRELEVTDDDRSSGS